MTLSSWKPQWFYLKARVTLCEKWPLALWWAPYIKGTGYLRSKKGGLLTFNILLSAECSLTFMRWFYIISAPPPLPLPTHHASHSVPIILISNTFLFFLASSSTPSFLFFFLLFDYFHFFIYSLTSLPLPITYF